MLYDTLKEAKVKLIQAQNMRAGIENARQTYINLLFNNEVEILKTFEKVAELEKQISELKEENELLNTTLAEQDQLLAKKKR